VRNCPQAQAAMRAGIGMLERSEFYSDHAIAKAASVISHLWAMPFIVLPQAICVALFAVPVVVVLPHIGACSVKHSVDVTPAGIQVTASMPGRALCTEPVQDGSEDLLKHRRYPSPWKTTYRFSVM
jgi:hypothetical protein